jgi:hypothetical protein
MSFDAFWNGLAATSYYVAIAPIVFSTLAHVRGFLLNEDELRKRCHSHREILNEKVNGCLFRIIDRFERSLTAVQLRGSPPNEPDLIADHTTEVVRVVHIHRILDGVETTCRRVHTILLVAGVAGVLCLIAAFPSARLRPYAAIVAYIVLLVQVWAVLCARHATHRLNAFERAT